MKELEELYEKSLSDFKKVIDSLTYEEKIKLLKSVVMDEIKREILITLSDLDKLKYIEVLNVDFFMYQVSLSITNLDIKKQIDEKIKSIHSKRLENIKFIEIYDKDKIESLKDKITISNFDQDISDKVCFGIELEVVNGFSNLVLTQNGYLCNRWEKNLDLSLPYNSIEVVSPILSYNLNDIKEIYLICKFLKENRLYPNDKCAFHIHIDRDYLNEDKRYLFYLLFSYYEEIFYLITNEEGTLPREYISEYSKPISNKINEINKDVENDKVISEVKSKIQDYKKNYCVNVVSPKGYNTIEFRMANGTIDANSIHQNIKLFIKFIDFVNRNNFDIINIIKDMNNEDKLIFLLDQIFSKEEDKVYFYDRYIENKKLLNDENIYQRYFGGK